MFVREGDAERRRQLPRLRDDLRILGGWIVAIGVGFAVATLAVGALDAPVSPEFIGVVHIVIWVLTSAGIIQWLAINRQEKEALQEYENPIDSNAAMLIKQFEEGRILKPTQIDSLVAHFLNRPDEFEALKAAKPGVAETIKQFMTDLS